MKVYPFVCIHERNEVNNMNEKTFNDVVNHMKTPLDLFTKVQKFMVVWQILGILVL